MHYLPSKLDGIARHQRLNRALGGITSPEASSREAMRGRGVPAADAFDRAPSYRRMIGGMLEAVAQHHAKTAL